MAREATNTVKAQDRSIDATLKRELEKRELGGAKRQCEWAVEGVPGLRLVLMKSGEASYHIRFMAGQGARRKQHRKSLGRANGPGAIGLAKARSIALAVAKDGPAALGIDAANGDEAATLERVFDQFEAWNSKPGNGDAIAPRTLADYRDQLERDVFPTLGRVPIGELTKKDIVACLLKVEKRSPNAAHKARAALGSLYRWAAKRDIVAENFMLGMGFTHKNKPRDRVPTDDEIKALWSAIESPEFDAFPSMRLVLKLAILTGQRNSEVAGAKKSELQIGAKVQNPRWQIPKERMKRKDRDQYVFLSTQAAELFREAAASAGDDPYVFPAKDDRSEHLAQDSVSHAFARARELAGIENLTLHDMRKAITTYLGDRGERGDVLDRIQHHHSGHATGNRSSVTESHYNFSVMQEPLRQAWQRWGDHVERVVAGTVRAPKSLQLNEAARR
ncbi:MAG: tyrosine-type recombinase/integrase [Hyphomicrobium sp.]